MQNKYQIIITKSQQENEEQAKNLKSQIEQLKLQSQNLSNQIVDMRSNYEMQITKTTSMTQSKVNNLEKQLLIEKEQKENSSTRIIQLEKQLADLQSNIKQDQTDELKSKINSLENQFLKLQKERDIILSSKQRGEEEIKILNTRIGELSNKNNQNEIELASLRSKQNNQISSAQNLSTLNQQILVLQQEKQSQTKDMMLLRQQIEKSNQDHEYQLTKIKSDYNKDLEAINRKQNDEILNLQNRIQFEKKEREVDQKRKAQADELISQLNQEKQLFQDQLKKERIQIEQLQLEINQLHMNQKNNKDEQNLFLQYSSCTNIFDHNDMTYQISMIKMFKILSLQQCICISVLGYCFLI